MSTEIARRARDELVALLTNQGVSTAGVDLAEREGQPIIKVVLVDTRGFVVPSEVQGVPVVVQYITFARLPRDEPTA